MITQKITNEQFINVVIAPMTKGEHEAKIDGDLKFEVTSGDATIRPTGSNSADLVSGEVGISNIKVTGDADLGEGVIDIEIDIQLEVVDAQAEHLEATFGEPQEK